MKEEKEQSWYSKKLGRSLISVLFGNFFEKKSNSSSIIALILVGTLCYIIIYKLLHNTDISDEMEIITNIVFVVIGYYFGSKQIKATNDDDEQMLLQQVLY